MKIHIIMAYVSCVLTKYLHIDACARCPTPICLILFSVQFRLLSYLAKARVSCSDENISQCYTLVAYFCPIGPVENQGLGFVYTNPVCVACLCACSIICRKRSMAAHSLEAGFLWLTTWGLLRSGLFVPHTYPVLCV